MRLYTADAIKDQVRKLLCKDCEETDVCPVCDYRELIDEILDAPTVDAEPVRHGYWEDVFKDGYHEWFQCSVCGKLGQYNLDNYCPYCGAMMDEEEENN